MFKKISDADLVNGDLPSELLVGVERLEVEISARSINLSNFPECLKEVSFNWCQDLETLTNIPASIETLGIFCSAITNLQIMPEGLKNLSLHESGPLQTLSNIPASLKTLNLSFTGITTLPTIPAGLEQLNIEGCRHLILTPELRLKLLAAEENGCAIQYPEHFSLDAEVDQTKERLAAISQIYKTLNPELPNPESIKTLLHRFLSENIGQRGGIKGVILSTKPVLDVFEQNPHHLQWADEVAKAFLDGCVNQPVLGWSEISALATIAQNTAVKDKVQAASHLMALDTLTAFVAQLPQDQKPGAAIEAEAGNALLMEVHKRLLKDDDIESAWLGVPRSIAYEGMVQRWLTEERVEEACNLVRSSVLGKTESEKANYLCEGQHGHSWCSIAFPEVVAAIKADYSQRIEGLTDQDLINQMPNQRDTAIFSKVRELTEEALMVPGINPEVSETVMKLSGENGLQR